MKLELRSRDLPLTPSLRRHCERRIAHALGRFRHKLGHVSVRLFDVNGPRGGEDKCCRILIDVIGGRLIVLEEHDADLWAAIDCAAGRAGHTVARELARVRAVQDDRRRWSVPDAQTA